MAGWKSKNGPVHHWHDKSGENRHKSGKMRVGPLRNDRPVARNPSLWIVVQ